MSDDTDSEDELPSGWEERATPQGWVYYTNHIEKTTQWTHPISGKRKVINCQLPYGWETQLDKDGNVYFVDHINTRTTYTDPRLAYATEVGPTSGKKVTYGSSSSAAEVLYETDLSDKVVLVTGGSSGIGYETVKALAFRGAHVFFTSRSAARAEEAVARMKSEYSKLQVEFLECDLCSLSSVSALAQRFKLRHLSLHILVLNAGTAARGRIFTEDGLESTFQVNFLSQVYLVLLLLPCLLCANLARVIWVSSESHRFHNIDTSPAIPDLAQYATPSAKQYHPTQAYNRSKLCGVLFTKAFQKRLGKLPVMVIAVHPGNLIYTNLMSHTRTFRYLYWALQPFTKSAEQGAACSCYCATALEVCYFPGCYFSNCRLVPAADETDDGSNQDRLWTFSLDLIKEKTGFSFEMPTRDDLPAKS